MRHDSTSKDIMANSGRIVILENSQAKRIV